MPYQQIPITAWAAEDRPREKLMQRGIGALNDAELIAILLGSGSREQSAIDLARHLLKETGGLAGLARSSFKALTRFNGIGPAKAISVVSAFELGRRKEYAHPERIKVTQSGIAARYLQPKLADEEREVFYLLFLNRNNEITGEQRIFTGGISATVIDPKLIFREAMLHLASGLIVAHNHPSGNLTPSRADLNITRKLREAGKLIDMPVLDHLIISHRGFYSFADEGQMK